MLSGLLKYFVAKVTCLPCTYQQNPSSIISCFCIEGGIENIGLPSHAEGYSNWPRRLIHPSSYIILCGMCHYSNYMKILQVISRLLSKYLMLYFGP